MADDAPGVPLGTGMEPVEDQEAERRHWAKIQAELAPRLEALERARREGLGLIGE